VFGGFRNNDDGSVYDTGESMDSSYCVFAGYRDSMGVYGKGGNFMTRIDYRRMNSACLSRIVIRAGTYEMRFSPGMCVHD
jgi:hypothetical protein